MTEQATDIVRKQPVLVSALAALGGFVVGLIIGLPVLGWLVWPVQWENAAFKDLRASDQQEYVRLVAASYKADLDADLAAERIGILGPEAATVISDTIGASQDKARVDVQQLKAVLEVQGALPAEELAAQQRSLLSQLQLPLLACGLVVVLALALGGVWYLRSSGALSRTARPRPATAGPGRMVVEAQRADYAAPGALATPTGTPPVAQWMTTYVLGDDLYDDSFSIDGPDGNFLGECGMGISETIGVGDPKKVTAFEVWLFDKNDIRTVTKVLMSEHAFRDEALKSRLAAKGEPVLVKSGDVVSMETAALVVTARVVDLAYGGGALPPSSFFERLTIELAAFSKVTAAQS